MKFRISLSQIEGRQSYIDDFLDDLNKEQVIGLLDNIEYRTWIIEELKERESNRKSKEE